MEYLQGQTLAERIAKGPLPRATSARPRRPDRGCAGGGAPRGHRPPGSEAGQRDAGKTPEAGVTPSCWTSAWRALRPRSRRRRRHGDGPHGGGPVAGTVPYMAPEQIEGRAVDARTDLFAFGATLYEMLTGRRAFEGTSPASVMAAILEHEPRAASTLQPAIHRPRIDRSSGAAWPRTPTRAGRPPTIWPDALRWLRDTEGRRGSGGNARPLIPRRRLSPVRRWSRRRSRSSLRPRRCFGGSSRLSTPRPSPA